MDYHRYDRQLSGQRHQTEDHIQERSGAVKKERRRRMHLVRTFVADIFIVALIMLAFYIVSYVIHPQRSGVELPAPVDGLTSKAFASTNTSDAIPSADPSSWRVKFTNKFTSGEVVQTGNSYKSANINVAINKVQKGSTIYYIADIYVVDIKNFLTAFAKQPDVMGARELTEVVAGENDAIIAINGDHCVDNSGPVIRNGKLYRDELYADALVMNYDGSMQTYSADQLNMSAIEANGAWQVWTFGPMLLKDGRPMKEFNSTLLRANPRTAVGYYEPGHYCFVVVDGRQPGYSDGMSLTDISQLFCDLGCKVAFNLDGGQSSEMVFMGKVINRPYDGGRSTTDILYIADQ